LAPTLGITIDQFIRALCVVVVNVTYECTGDHTIGVANTVVARDRDATAR
jgi:hypothetical protein